MPRLNTIKMHDTGYLKSAKKNEDETVTSWFSNVECCNTSFNVFYLLRGYYIISDTGCHVDTGCHAGNVFVILRAKPEEAFTPRRRRLS